jgi:hypothetical protein
MPVGINLFIVGHIANKVARKQQLKAQKGKDATQSDEYNELVEALSKDKIKVGFGAAMTGTLDWMAEQRYMVGYQRVMDALNSNDDYKKREAVIALMMTPAQVLPTNSNYYKYIGNLFDNSQETKRRSSEYLSGFQNFVLNNSVMAKLGSRPPKVDVLGNQMYKEEDLGLGGLYNLRMIAGFVNMSEDAKKNWDYVQANNLYLNSEAIWRKSTDVAKKVLKDEGIRKEVISMYEKKYGKSVPSEPNLQYALSNMVWESMTKKYGAGISDINKNSKKTLEQKQAEVDRVRNKIIKHIGKEFGIKN